MAESLRSLLLYAKLVSRAWWQLVIGFLAAIYGAVSALESGLLVPWWAGLAVAVAALSWAQFRAFHIVRLQLDSATSGTDLLRAIGIVNELGPMYWPGQVGRPVDRADNVSSTEANELYVRVALGPWLPLPGAELTQAARDRFRAAMDTSTVEWWLRQRTGAPCAWTLDSHTHFRAVAVRVPHRDATGPAVLYGDAQFLLPTGPQSPRAILLVDVVFDLTLRLGSAYRAPTCTSCATRFSRRSSTSLRRSSFRA